MIHVEALLLKVVVTEVIASIKNYSICPLTLEMSPWRVNKRQSLTYCNLTVMQSVNIR